MRWPSFRKGCQSHYSQRVLSLFIVAALMLVFGIAPFGFDIAKEGIIGCVFGLIGVGVLNVLLEAIP